MVVFFLLFKARTRNQGGKGMDKVSERERKRRKERERERTTCEA